MSKVESCTSTELESDGFGSADASHVHVMPIVNVQAGACIVGEESNLSQTVNRHTVVRMNS